MTAVGGIALDTTVGQIAAANATGAEGRGGDHPGVPQLYFIVLSVGHAGEVEETGEVLTLLRSYGRAVEQHHEVGDAFVMADCGRLGERWQVLVGARPGELW